MGTETSASTVALLSGFTLPGCFTAQHPIHVHGWWAISCFTAQKGTAKTTTTATTTHNRWMTSSQTQASRRAKLFSPSSWSLASYVGRSGCRFFKACYFFFLLASVRSRRMSDGDTTPPWWRWLKGLAVWQQMFKTVVSSFFSFLYFSCIGVRGIAKIDTVIRKSFPEFVWCFAPTMMVMFVLLHSVILIWGEGGYDRLSVYHMLVCSREEYLGFLHSGL